ncbi:hypothetical protein NGI46_02170 [Peribacillus butanolivorans]|nr:hypothetical protein [Peribacillus butanolivorans]MCO0596264.1 hypothetical protein [Peribacillus butanolivorans]
MVMPLMLLPGFETYSLSVALVPAISELKRIIIILLYKKEFNKPLE